VPRDGPRVGPSEIHRAICAVVADCAPADLADIGRIAGWVYEMRGILRDFSAQLDDIEEATMRDLLPLVRG
jgi:hypothetical protein